jgi:hypothetical protein
LYQKWHYSGFKLDLFCDGFIDNKGKEKEEDFEES